MNTEQKVKHTPGPWVVFYPKVKGCGYGIDCADGSRSIVVFEDNAGVGSGDFSTDEEDLANAKLIAAAPELLESLKEAKEHLDYIGWGDDWERQGMEKLQEQIEDVIKRATE